MDWKTILVQLSNPRRTDVLVSVASRLAERANAHLIGFNVGHALAHMPTMPTLVGPEDFAAFEAIDDEQAARLKGAFDEATRNRAFVAEWRNVAPSGTDPVTTVIEHGRAADLIVASQADPDWEMSGFFDAPERLALESGRPVLVVPYAGRFGEIGKRVMVAWSGKRESARAAFDALPLLKAADAVTVHCVVGRDADGEPGQLPGAEIAASLARHGVKVTVRKSIADEIGVADEILARLADDGSDLLVMGAYGHSRPHPPAHDGADADVALSRHECSSRVERRCRCTAAYSSQRTAASYPKRPSIMDWHWPRRSAPR
jgi:nucleotide-binding universal stress UspA family protein